MLIKEFYVIPENNEDNLFVENNMKLLLDLSLRDNSMTTSKTYEEIITNKFNEWREAWKTHQNVFNS